MFSAMNRTNFHKLLFNFLRQISGFKDLCGLVFLPQIKGLKDLGFYLPRIVRIIISRFSDFIIIGNLLICGDKFNMQ
ncbi:hypothetical protein BKM63_07550 [Flavobacterium johnsoniae]|uniref:Uncharacterized protein n=1 Tax=Flavobacterium johnsoniae TaxID=986 RepID=A0A1J7CMF2_FLAJO|nr:hypothetical protein BKM63_07550 [Flavobacterium johnsoniae]